MAHLRQCWCGRIYRHESEGTGDWLDWRLIDSGYSWKLIPNLPDARCPDLFGHGPPPKSIWEEVFEAIVKESVEEMARIEDQKFLDIVEETLCHAV